MLYYASIGTVLTSVAVAIALIVKNRQREEKAYNERLLSAYIDDEDN